MRSTNLRRALALALVASGLFVFWFIAEGADISIGGAAAYVFITTRSPWVQIWEVLGLYQGPQRIAQVLMGKEAALGLLTATVAFTALRSPRRRLRVAAGESLLLFAPANVIAFELLVSYYQHASLPIQVADFLAFYVPYGQFFTNLHVLFCCSCLFVAGMGWKLYGRVRLGFPRDRRLQVAVTAVSVLLVSCFLLIGLSNFIGLPQAPILGHLSHAVTPPHFKGP